MYNYIVFGHIYDHYSIFIIAELMVCVHQENDILNENTEPADVLQDVDLADEVQNRVARDRLVELHLVLVVFRLFHHVLKSEEEEMRN